jgi:hypothetical protein
LSERAATNGSSIEQEFIMGLFSISEQKVQGHLQTALEPGEQVQQIVLGTEKPFWTKVFFRIGYFFWNNYIVATTNRRVVFVKYGGLLSGFKSKQVDAFGLADLDSAKLGWGIFNKNLTLKSAGRNFKRTVEVRRFGHRKGNFDAAQATVVTVEQSRMLLGAGPAHNRLS